MNQTSHPAQTRPAARDLIRRALALRILEAEDLGEISFPPPPDSLERLVSAGRLSAAAAEALVALAIAKPRAAAVPALEPPGGTLEGERGAASAVALAPEEGPSLQGGGLQGASQGTLDGERAEGVGVSLQPGELAEPLGGTLDGERGIGAGIRLGDSDEPAPALDGTLDGERGLGEGIQLGEGSTAEAPPLLDGTMDGERSHEAGIRLGEGPGEEPAAAEPALAPEGDESALFDFSELSDEHQQAIQNARVVRVAVQLEKITWDQARAAWGASRPASEWLAAEGYLDPFQAMEVFSEAQAIRSICPLTLQVQEERQGGTLAQGGPEKARGIEGFPGVGGTFAGHELLDRVAEGAMGVVFRARHLKLNRVVAMKVMRGGALASENRKRRFLGEAEAAAALGHSSIVPVHEISEVNGYPFYTMDYIEGRTLEVHVKEESCEPSEVARLMRELAEGVQHFHQHGIIHRDLKPENVLVSPEGPRIIDFGIAKRLGDEGGSGTVDGALIGTPEYMAPEQAAGRVREVDIRTDVYALGVITYELLTGSVPFSGSHAAIVLAIQEKDPERVLARRPDLDRDLAAITEKAMAKEPERRYQSAAELVEDLDRYLNHLPVVARPATIRYRLGKAIRRNFAAVVAGAVCVAALLLSAGYFAQRALAREARVAELIQRSEGEALGEKDRDDLLTQALALDPENAAALTKRQALRERREAAKRLAEQEAALREQEAKLEAQRAEQRAEQARADLAKERAQQEARALKERERARLSAEQEARTQAEVRARQILERSQEAEDSLAAIGLVSDALVILPPGPGPLRRELEERKLSLGLKLSDQALDREEASMARFWLRQCAQLSVAKEAAPQASLAERTRRLELLLTGAAQLKEAKRLARAGRWLEARERLAQARAQGLSPATLAAEERVVEARCRAQAAQLVAEGQKLLAERAWERALGSARRALEFQPSSVPAQALIAEAEGQLVDHVQREAALLSQGSGSRAIAKLEQAERLVRGAPAQLLLAERRARAALSGDALVYLPNLRGSETGGVYLQRYEVTNEAFARFVETGGYAEDAFWPDAPGVAEIRRRGAPLTWRDKSYGDSSNRRRPVRGVSAFEAEAYARWLSRESGGRWRLPRPDEWEFAASWDPASARSRAFPWGDEFGGWSARRPQQPAEVGHDERDRSALGVVGLGGGVIEWVSGPGGPATKGACWAAPPHLAERYARVEVSGSPGALPPRELAPWIGFRLVQEVPQ